MRRPRALSRDVCEVRLGVCLSYWREIKGDSLRPLAQCLIQACFDLLVLFFSLLANIPIFQCDKEKGVITGSDEAQQANTDDAGGVLHTRRFGQDFLDLLRDLVGAPQ